MNRVWTAVWVVALAAAGVVFAWFAITSRGEQASSAPSAEVLEPEIADEAPGVARFLGDGYALAQVRAGEKIEIVDSPGGKVVARLGSRTEFDSPRVLPVLDPGKHWLGVAAPELGNGAVGWLRYDPDELALGDTQISLRVDLSERTMELRHGNDHRLPDLCRERRRSHASGGRPAVREDDPELLVHRPQPLQRRPRRAVPRRPARRPAAGRRMVARPRPADPGLARLQGPRPADRHLRRG